MSERFGFSDEELTRIAQRQDALEAMPAAIDRYNAAQKELSEAREAVQHLLTELGLDGRWAW